MNRNTKLYKFIIFVLLITIAVTCLVFSTYAKYTSSVAGEDTATVAKWSFNVNDTDIAGTTQKTITFNIFSTITNTDDSTETNVKSTDGSIIAPGTKGSFNIDVENTSEVTAEYKVTYEITNTGNVPLEFSNDGTTWSTDISSITETAFTEVEIGGSKTTKTIYWRWAFTDTTTETATETRDNVDTALGIMETLPTVTVKATLLAQQVD